MTKLVFHTTRGQVYKKLRNYKFDYLAPRQHKIAETHKGRLQDEAKIETFKQQVEYDRQISRLEFNMNYNESVHMDLEDHDAPNPYFPCDSDAEHQKLPFIDLVSDSDADIDEAECYEIVRLTSGNPATVRHDSDSVTTSVP